MKDMHCKVYRNNALLIFGIYPPNKAESLMAFKAREVLNTLVCDKVVFHNGNERYEYSFDNKLLP